MQVPDNVNHTVRDDLRHSIRKKSKLSIAAACFLIYTYQELKQQMESVEELRFIYTSPNFTTQNTPKAKREFYIPWLNRERRLYGTEFEVPPPQRIDAKSDCKLDIPIERKQFSIVMEVIPVFIDWQYEDAVLE